jgi:O-antigen/teichoic acid export membrane protein
MRHGASGRRKQVENTFDMTIIKKMVVNISSNYLGAVIHIVVALILTPLLVRHFGEIGYGVWITLSTIILFIGYIDLGLGDAIVKYVAEYNEVSDQNTLQKTIGTALSIYLILGFVALILSIFISFFVTSFFNIPSDYAEAAKAGLIYFGLLLLVEFPTTALYSIIEGHQRYDILNIVGIASTIIEALATIVLILLDCGLLEIIQLSLAISVMEFVTALLFTHHIYPDISLKTTKVDIAVFHKLKRFSFWLFMFDLVSDGWVHLQKLIIPILFYTSLTTHYSIAIMLASIMLTAVEPFVNVMFPLVSALGVKNDKRNLKNVMLYGTKCAMAISMPVSICVLILGEPLISFLFGDDYLDTVYNLIRIMIYSFLATASILPAISLLTGIGRIKKLFFFALAECLSVILLMALTKNALGIYSIAFSFTAANIVFSFGLVLPYTCKVINMPFVYFLRESMLKPILPIFPVYVLGSILVELIDDVTVLTMCGLVVLIAVVYGILFYIFSFSMTERATMVEHLKLHLKK